MSIRKEHLYNASQLIAKAKESREKADLTQTEAAQRLGVSPSAISKAEDPENGSRYLSTCVDILEEISQLQVDGPYWHIRRRRGRPKGP